MDAENGQIRFPRLNFSRKHKILWFTPLRTASRSCVPIMEYFDFDIVKNHDEIFPYDSDDYTIIMNVHNPYKRLFSVFSFIKNEKKSQNLNFRPWIEKIIENSNKTNDNPSQLWLSKCFLSLKREPNHIVKVENLMQDLMKIDFIYKNMTNQLEKIFHENINSNQYLENNPNNWKMNYDENLSNYIFKNFKNDFELFGYDQNSWK